MWMLPLCSSLTRSTRSLTCCATLCFWNLLNSSSSTSSEESSSDSDSSKYSVSSSSCGEKEFWRKLNFSEPLLFLLRERLLIFANATVSEWLRRLTRNQLEQSAQVRTLSGASLFFCLCCVCVCCCSIFVGFATSPTNLDPYTLTQNRLYFGHLSEIIAFISDMSEIEAILLNTRFRDG